MPNVSPAVSIVVPCYGQAHVLGDALDSLAAQAFTDWACIVVAPHEQSEDVQRVLSRFSGARIRTLPGHPHHEQNRPRLLLEPVANGPGSARNFAIATTRSGYLLPLDADDMIAPGFLERTMRVLDDPGVSIAFTDVQCFGVDRHSWATGPFSREALVESNRLPYCALYRREVWEALGGYREGFCYEDWDFWLGAATLGFRATSVREPLFFYRTGREPSRHAALRERHEDLAREVRERWPLERTP